MQKRLYQLNETVQNHICHGQVIHLQDYETKLKTYQAISNSDEEDSVILHKLIIITVGQNTSGENSVHNLSCNPTKIFAAVDTNGKRILRIKLTHE